MQHFKLICDVNTSQFLKIHIHVQKHITINPNINLILQPTSQKWNVLRCVAKGWTLGDGWTYITTVHACTGISNQSHLKYISSTIVHCATWQKLQSKIQLLGNKIKYMHGKHPHSIHYLLEAPVAVWPGLKNILVI